MTNISSPQGSEPQLMRREQGWNTLAIVALALPIAVFILAQVVSRLFLGTAGVDENAMTQQDVNQLLTNSTWLVAVELVLYIAGVVVAHLSLRAGYRGLRGRGMGIAGLVLSYLGVVICIIGLLAIVALPILIRDNPSLFTGA